MAQPIKKLDWQNPQKVDYCIPMWLRDEQIRLATARVKGRIAPVYELRSEPIAVVCYGPSLNETWEKIREFKWIMSCSGASSFLIERGMVPTWHIAVDPLPGNSRKLIGTPHPDVEYLISSTCHQDVFDLLEGFNVKLWHVFDNQEEAIRILPAGEWALTGGCSVGLRALTMAHFLGFKDLHVFGMDGSEGLSGKHAGAHPGQPPGHSIVDYNGTEYRTTPSMLEVARGTWHELDNMPEVTATFYGEGLVQAMAKDYKRKPLPKGTPLLGFAKPELISAEYKRLNEELHRTNLAYGVGGDKHAPVVLKLAETLKTKNILDYGCGKGRLSRALPFHIAEYDPAIPGKEESPKPADLVVCTDVLEHIEPEKLPFVLGDLQRVTRQMGFFVIHTGPSGKVLADGRNAHILQRRGGWWEKVLRKVFEVPKTWEVGPLFYVLVTPKRKKSPKWAVPADVAATSPQSTYCSAEPCQCRKCSVYVPVHLRPPSAPAEMAVVMGVNEV